MTYKLGSFIFKINHSIDITPLVRYFLNILSQLLKRVNMWVPQHLQSWHSQELHLWIKILQWVTEKVVLIKNIIFMTSTFTICSDAWKYGIGGYNDKVMAWCWNFSPEWHGVLTLNLLEFLAWNKSIYMTIQQLGHVSHILALTDSSSDLGWMHK